jgi:hypothetical protein
VFALLLSMLRARSAQALTVFLLAAAATAAAASAPVYVATADRTVVEGEVAGATTAERTVHAARIVFEGDERTFERIAPTALALPGFRTIFAADIDAYVEGPKGSGVPRLVYRDDFCANVRITSGRCFAGTTEVVLAAATAEHLGVAVGSQLIIQRVAVGRDGYQTVPGITLFTVVGVYEPIDKYSVYWGNHDYFNTDNPDRGTIAEPLFVARRTLELVTTVRQNQSVEATAEASAITADTVYELEAALNKATSDVRGAKGTITTDMPQLLNRIQRNRNLVAEIVPLAAIPLVLLCWFVLFLAVAAGTQHRRHELGLLALRGLRLPYRWWLGAGEAILPILLGAAAGLVLGHVAVRVAAQALLDGGPAVPLRAGLSRYVLVALAGAFVAGLLAQRQQLAQPAIDLLREVPARVKRWRSAALESVVVVLAVLAAVQMQTGDENAEGERGGIGMFAPALMVLAFGLIAARAVVPLADRFGSRALRRGRIGPALAAYGLARRPGGQRLLVLFVVAVALVCFAATAADTARVAREQRLTVELGAPRVVDVGKIRRADLLARVRAADPEGRFAMAVAPVPRSQRNEPMKLAVDATRLAAVAAWRPDLPASDAAARLRPKVAEPIVLRGREVGLDVTATKLDELPIQLTLYVAPVDGQAAGQEIELGILRAGRRTYSAPVVGCEEGCRLVALQAEQLTRRSFTLDAIVHGLRVGGATVLDPSALTVEHGWHTGFSSDERVVAPEVSTDPAGLRIRQAYVVGTESAARFYPGDTPRELPLVTAGWPGVKYVSGFDGNDAVARSAAAVPDLPRLGRIGALVDLEYLDRSSIDFRSADNAEVWLGEAAPADALDRLRAQGLVLGEERTFDALREALGQQGPSVALRFHLLAGGFAVLLVLGGLWFVNGMDRRVRAPELRALRTQGMSRRAVRTAAVRGYLLVVLAAAIVGPLAAAACWLVAGWTIPLFADDVRLIPPPRWPSPLGVILAWAVAGGTLAVIAIVGGVRLARAVERGSGR